MMGDLCAYAFVGNYKTYPNSCSFGLVVSPPSSDSFKDGYDVVAHKLGFNNLNEYVKAYPGNFDKDSPQKIALIGGSEEYNSRYRYSKTNIEPLSSGNDVHVGAGGYSTQFLTTKFPFITPTLKEMSEIIEYTNPKSKYLWYCLDWRDNSVWVDLQC